MHLKSKSYNDISGFLVIISKYVAVLFTDNCSLTGFIINPDNNVSLVEAQVIAGLSL